MTDVLQDPTSITRVAMWSGPRNISTAMMRAWENRPDTFVTDEPFYAHYLIHTGINHPGRDDVISSQANDWQQVVEHCSSATDASHRVHYQKHMTQHMLEHIDLTWIENTNNIFLIRSPEEVVSSYAKTRPDVTPADLGFEQQYKLYQHILANVDTNPLVVLAADVLKHPRAALAAMCEKSHIEFSEAMLQWPAGTRESDGVWSVHWYANVEKSTGFGPYKAPTLDLNTTQKEIAERCQPYFEELLQNRAMFSET